MRRARVCDGLADAAASAWPAAGLRQQHSARPPLQVDPVLLRDMKVVDFVGYVQNTDKMRLR